MTKAEIDALEGALWNRFSALMISMSLEERFSLSAKPGIGFHWPECLLLS